MTNWQHELDHVIDVDVQAILNKRSECGWELVSAVSERAAYGKPLWFHLFWKRQLSAGETLAMMVR